MAFVVFFVLLPAKEHLPHKVIVLGKHHVDWVLSDVFDGVPRMPNLDLGRCIFTIELLLVGSDDWIEFLARVKIIV